jgi:hypothetical protein
LKKPKYGRSAYTGYYLFDIYVKPYFENLTEKEMLVAHGKVDGTITWPKSCGNEKMACCFILFWNLIFHSKDEPLRIGDEKSL